VITDLELMREHTSFWQSLSPLSEDFIRRINLHVLDRSVAPVVSVSAPFRRALVNEVGFECFSRSIIGKCALENLTGEEIRAISADVQPYISRLRTERPRCAQDIQDHEVDEVRAISKRLLQAFGEYNVLVTRPSFAGCGRLNQCSGDIIADRVLYEVKSRDRNFRSVDLRQLAIYLTLNHYSRLI
jgi:hypothetical protein